MALGLEFLQGVFTQALMSMPAKRACKTYIACQNLVTHSKSEMCPWTEVCIPVCFVYMLCVSETQLWFLEECCLTVWDFMPVSMEHCSTNLCIKFTSNVFFCARTSFKWWWFWKPNVNTICNCMLTKLWEHLTGGFSLQNSKHTLKKVINWRGKVVIESLTLTNAKVVVEKKTWIPNQIEKYVLLIDAYS